MLSQTTQSGISIAKIQTRDRSTTRVCEKCWNAFNNARTRGRSSQDEPVDIPGTSGVQLSPSAYHHVDEQVRGDKELRNFEFTKATLPVINR